MVTLNLNVLKYNYTNKNEALEEEQDRLDVEF